jgi:LacI family transcriptional regulator
MPSSVPVKLQVIADQVGVSRTTVSLALRNHAKIPAATRERIKRVAEELGYRPNPLVSAHMALLRTLQPKHTGLCLAFVCNRSLREVMADSLTPLRLYYEGAKARAEETGYALQYFNLRERGMTERRLSQILLARGIHGVVIAPLSEGSGVSNVELQWESFALAMIEHTFLEPRLHKVCNDEFSTVGRLIQRLLDYGHERIGIAMHSRMDDHANHLWLAGFQAFQALTDRRHRVPHFITMAWNKTAFLAWYRKHRPEAIITINSDIVGWLREAGHEVPEEVSCASLYWRKERNNVSGYYQSHELMAAAAVDHVIGQLNRNERGLPASEKTTLIQAEWREGATLRRKTPPNYFAPLRVWTR